MGLNSSEQDALEGFIKFGEGIYGFDTTKAASFSLILLDEKNGALMKPDLSGSELDEFENHLENIGLVYQKDNDGRYYITDDQRKIDKYNPASGGDSDLGNFFGYPDDAIDFYTSSRSNDEFREKEDNLSSSERDALNLLEYIPAPENIDDAVERGQKRAKMLRRCGVSNMSTALPLIKNV